MTPKWQCSFCSNSSDSTMVHTTCIIEGKHLYFCPVCWRQWEGLEDMTNVKLIGLRSEKCIQ